MHKDKITDYFQIKNVLFIAAWLLFRHVLLSTGRRPVSDFKKGILSTDLFFQTAIPRAFPRYFLWMSIVHTYAHTQSLASVIIRQVGPACAQRENDGSKTQLLFKNNIMHHVDIQKQQKFTKTNNLDHELNRTRTPALFSSADVSQPILTHPKNLRVRKKRRPLGCGVKLCLCVAIIHTPAENVL